VKFRLASFLPCVAAIALGACADADETPSEPFALRFQAVAGGAPVGCGSVLQVPGPEGTYAIGIADLRFFVGNVRAYDADGAELALELDENAFQYASAAGQVSLIDLTANDLGDCAGSALAFAEGTARTHDVITGVVDGEVARVSFDVGVPQALMKEVIGTHTAEGAPSPLNELYWSWASGYRHYVFNFSVTAPSGQRGEGYLHIGSADCGEGALALDSKDTCGFVNTPAVILDAFNPSTQLVTLDLASSLQGLSFVTPIYDPVTYEVIGEGPGVSCHSSPMQPDCPPIFSSFGIDIASGIASAPANRVFSRQ